MPREIELPAEVVSDDPAPPEELDRVEQLAQAVHVRRRPDGRRGVDTHPPELAQVRLDPRMRAVLADGDVLSDGVPFAAQEPVHVAGRHARPAQQQGRRRREVLAVSGPAVEEEPLNRIGAPEMDRQLDAVLVGLVEPAHHGHDLASRPWALPP